MNARALDELAARADDTTQPGWGPVQEDLATVARMLGATQEEVNACRTWKELVRFLRHELVREWTRGVDNATGT
jgi:hypothetical protein